jgi:hypothetical protein
MAKPGQSGPDGLSHGTAAWTCPASAASALTWPGSTPAPTRCQLAPWSVERKRPAAVPAKTALVRVARSTETASVQAGWIRPRWSVRPALTGVQAVLGSMERKTPASVAAKM